MPTFEQIPDNINTPGVYHEAHSSPDGRVAGQPHRVLLVGIKTSAGTQPSETIRKVRSVDEAEGWAGVGSQAAQMVRAFRKINRRTEIYLMVIDEVAGGTAAAGVITISGTATEAGTLAFLIGGQRLHIPVAVGDTAAAIITAGVAIAADADHKRLPVAVADGTGDTFGLTAKWKGVSGNQIDLRINHYEGEKTPAGITVVFTTPMATGATDPDFEDLVAGLDDLQYHKVVHALTDSANLPKVKAEMASRHEALRDLMGLAISAYVETQANSETKAAAMNDKFLSCMFPGKTPTTPWECAAIYAAEVSVKTEADRSQSWGQTPLRGIIAPLRSDQWSRDERDQVIAAGGSTVIWDASGSGYVERGVTTYRTNSLGATDLAWQNAMLVTNLIGWRYGINQTLLPFIDWKLVPDGTVVQQGVKAVTPGSLLTAIFAYFLTQELQAHVVDFASFKEAATSEINSGNADMVDIGLQPKLVSYNLINRVVTRFLRAA